MFDDEGVIDVDAAAVSGSFDSDEVPFLGPASWHYDLALVADPANVIVYSAVDEDVVVACGDWGF